jgi:thiol-disulfide isomerase/thioredoxin
MDGKPLAVVLMAGMVLARAVAAEPRPTFPAIKLSDLSGQTYQLKDFLGTATVLNFWATWCGPCRIEMPELQKLYNELGGKGLVVLAVDVDVAFDPTAEEASQVLPLLRQQIETFLSRTGITLPVYFIDGRTQAELGVGRIPMSVLLDREGGVVRIYAGYSAASVKDLREQILGVLAERTKQGGK